jgi:ribosomal protein S18 acetylase RimI-like enzyme
MVRYALELFAGIRQGDGLADSAQVLKLQEVVMIKVRQAGIGDLDALAPLFDAYRQFYKRASDPTAAREFLFQRFQHQQSVIFIAHDDKGVAIGFTQLYPLFSSLTLARTFVLYDLFVAPSARRSGAARKLLRAAADYGRAVGAGALELSTATDNEAAQRLYESEGWVRDTAFYVYGLGL